MYAVPLEGGAFILDNSPFYVYGISCCDKFEAIKKDDRLIFSKVLERGGHSTYRIKLPPGADHNYFLILWETLKRMGCTYEGSSSNTARLYAVDMAPSVNVEAAYAYLELKENDGAWVFEEGHYYDPQHGSVSIK
ncbi:DUF4265 domain-containing protein [Hydrocarboniphaga effusa]|jgi:hypothetical protein|uniref:DUF4265 domain-containing protein n=1 Tax=Hydrocarboniphaga effusa TaxID=243629 RepID=UPI002ABAFB3F|nr:DUF4265 domain-containing protein [Polynucleobacter sp.]